MNELYSAKKAREYSMAYRYKDEIEAVNNKIVEAVVKGETSCEYYNLPSFFVEDTFKDLGYIVTVNETSWTDSGYTTYISW